MDANERNKRWFSIALRRELTEIEKLPLEKVQKAGSSFFICLLKVASLVKGSNGEISADFALNKIKYACRHLNLQAKEIDYQWGRAFERAKPRRPESI